MLLTFSGLFEATKIHCYPRYTYGIWLCYCKLQRCSSPLLLYLGPLTTTLIDFWRLVWQEEVKVIVMLTEVEEQGQKKSEQYWPDQGNLEYAGPFRVILVDQQVFADYIIRTMQVLVSLLFHRYFYHTMNFELHRQQYAIFPTAPCIPPTPPSSLRLLS